MNRLKFRRLNDVAWGTEVWRCVEAHTGQHHRLRLRVDDDAKVLECTVCELPVVTGSEGIMDAICKALGESGITFEVVCETRRPLH